MQPDEVQGLYRSIDQIMTEVDANNDKFIDFGEFLMVMRKLLDGNFAGIKDNCAFLAVSEDDDPTELEAREEKTLAARVKIGIA